MKDRTKFESHRVSLTEILQRYFNSVCYLRDEGIKKITIFNNERISGVQKHIIVERRRKKRT